MRVGTVADLVKIQGVLMQVVSVSPNALITFRSHRVHLPEVFPDDFPPAVWGIMQGNGWLEDEYYGGIFYALS